MTALATIALDEYRRRKASVDTAVHARGFAREEGERLLRCWLAIALSAGAKPSECGPEVDRWQGRLADHYARFLLLEELPPRRIWQGELTRARDAAARKARLAPTDAALGTRHHALDSLCIHLGCDSEFGAPSNAGRSASAELGSAAGAATGSRPLAAATKEQLGRNAA